jgi:hypothetical protein
MKIRFKLLLALVCVLFCADLRAEDTALCTTASINAIIKANHGSDTKLNELWAELQDKHIVRIRDEDENVRPQMVKMQAVMESALASLLKDKNVKYAKAVIYTSRPETALRATDYNLEALVDKSFFEDKNRLQTITARMNSIKQYLDNGGQLYSVRKTIKEGSRNKKNHVPELNIYTNNLIHYRNSLTDKPVEKLNGRYIGASYIAECKDGKKLFFSIKGREEHDTKPKQWVLYYGELSNSQLNKYYTKVQEVYKKTAEVPFDFN